MHTDDVFVAVIILALMAILLRAGVELVLRHVLFWVPGEAGPDNPGATISTPSA
jgi:ABC-type nitrate/sulfonate/bicarbonate transport system permease component